MPDALGADGNGIYWFAADDAAITNHPIYQQFSQMQITDMDPPVLMAQIKNCYGSTEAAPIMNYLWWLLQIVKEVA